MIWVGAGRVGRAAVVAAMGPRAVGGQPGHGRAAVGQLWRTALAVAAEQSLRHSPLIGSVLTGCAAGQRAAH